MKYVEAPDVWEGAGHSLFLAGSITGCPDWQRDAVGMLEDCEDLIVCNPRRENFPIDDPSAAEQQITWEHDCLRQVDAISFWFSKDSLGPIVLYELGAWSMSDKLIFVGVEPGYQRSQDVEIQTRLVRPEVKICTELSQLMCEVGMWSSQQ